MAAVDESAITGESAHVIKESGGDFSSVTGGTKVMSDYIKIKVSSDPGESFLDRMIDLVEGAKRQKTPNEIALSTLLVSLTLIFLLVCVTLVPIASYIKVTLPIATLVALLVCLIPTTIGGLSFSDRHSWNGQSDTIQCDCQSGKCGRSSRRHQYVSFSIKQARSHMVTGWLMPCCQYRV